LAFLSAVLVSACDDATPSAPSSAARIVGSPAPPPPAVDLSGLVGVWDITVRLTEVSGRGCVGDTMRSQIGEPAPYSLTLTRRANGNSLDVRLVSAAGDYACNFTTVPEDSGGFSTYDEVGYFDCDETFRPFRCGDGTARSLFSWGQNIAGRVSGTEISGTWDADWDDMAGDGVGTKSQFTGRRR
jgi:hypothetical protein